MDKILFALLKEAKELGGAIFLLSWCIYAAIYLDKISAPLVYVFQGVVGILTISAGISALKSLYDIHAMRKRPPSEVVAD